MKTLKALLIAGMMLAAAPALAIDFTTVLNDPDGKPFLDCVRYEGSPPACAETTPLTLSRLAVAGLDQPVANEQYADKVKRGVLQAKVYGAKDVALSVAEIKTIEDAISKLQYRTFAIFQAAKLLDPQGVPK